MAKREARTQRGKGEGKRERESERENMHSHTHTHTHTQVTGPTAAAAASEVPDDNLARISLGVDTDARAGLLLQSLDGRAMRPNHPSCDCGIAR